MYKIPQCEICKKFHTICIFDTLYVRDKNWTIDHVNMVLWINLDQLSLSCNGSQAYKWKLFKVNPMWFYLRNKSSLKASSSCVTHGHGYTQYHNKLFCAFKKWLNLSLLHFSNICKFLLHAASRHFCLLVKWYGNALAQ